MIPKSIAENFCLAVLLVISCQGCVSQRINDERYGSKFRPILFGDDVQKSKVAQGTSIIICRITVDRSLYKAQDKDRMGPQSWQWAWSPPLNFYDKDGLIAGKSPSLRYSSEWLSWFPIDTYHQSFKERLSKIVSDGYDGFFFDIVEPGEYILASEKHEFMRKGVTVKTMGGKEVIKFNVPPGKLVILPTVKVFLLSREFDMTITNWTFEYRYELISEPDTLKHFQELYPQLYDRYKYNIVKINQ